MIEFLLNDCLQANLSGELGALLTDENKGALLDSMFDQNKEPLKRGLHIGFDITHGGKVINGRVYEPHAQAASLSDWTKPVGAPLIKNHDTDADPLGRVYDAKWVSLEKEARAFLGDKGYNEVVAAYNTKDAVEIGKVMNKYRLINNPKWPGLSTVKLSAKVSDKDTAEKFLDQRHMQFSSGARAKSAPRCSKCGSAFTGMNSCGHVPGRVTEDGDVPFLVYGSYGPREATVTAFPADKTATITHMSFDPLTLSDSEAELTVDFSTTTVYEALETYDCELLDIDMSVFEKTQTAAEEVVAQETTVADDEVVSVNWFMLGLALDGLVKDRLETDVRANLDDKFFCDTDKFFCIPDKAYLDAARVLADKYTGVDAEAFKQALEAKAIELEPVFASKELEDKLAAKDSEIALLSESLATALKDCEKTSDSLLKVLEAYAVVKHFEISDTETSNKLDVLLDWFDNGDVEKLNVSHARDIVPVEDPTLAADAEEDLKPVESLSSAERNVVKRYRTILNDTGEDAAKAYLTNLMSKRFIGFDFDPNLYTDFKE